MASLVDEHALSVVTLTLPPQKWLNSAYLFACVPCIISLFTMLMWLAHFLKLLVACSFFTCLSTKFFRNGGSQRVVFLYLLVMYCWSSRTFNVTQRCHVNVDFMQPKWCYLSMVYFLHETPCFIVDKSLETLLSLFVLLTILQLGAQGLKLTIALANGLIIIF